MNCLLAYLISGVAVLLLMLSVHFKTHGFHLKVRGKLTSAIDQHDWRWPENVLRYRVAPLMTGLAVVLIWPVALIFQIRELKEQIRNARCSRDRNFSLRKRDLLNPVLFEDVEAAEQVFDPLGAVPNVPFGHLHPAWHRFIVNFDLDDDIWRFVAKRHPYPGWTEIKRGYALVQRGRVRHYFIVSNQRIVDENPIHARV